MLQQLLGPRSDLGVTLVIRPRLLLVLFGRRSISSGPKPFTTSTLFCREPPDSPGTLSQLHSQGVFASCRALSHIHRGAHLRSELLAYCRIQLARRLSLLLLCLQPDQASPLADPGSSAQ